MLLHLGVFTSVTVLMFCVLWGFQKKSGNQDPILQMIFSELPGSRPVNWTQRRHSASSLRLASPHGTMGDIMQLVENLIKGGFVRFYCTRRAALHGRRGETFILSDLCVSLRVFEWSYYMGGFSMCALSYW